MIDALCLRGADWIGFDVRFGAVTAVGMLGEQCVVLKEADEFIAWHESFNARLLHIGFDPFEHQVTDFAFVGFGGVRPDFLEAFKGVAALNDLSGFGCGKQAKGL